MLGSVALEIGIGIILVNILVSTICSTLREGIEAWLKTRAAYLEYSIREMFNDKSGTGIAKSLFNHPLIYSLFAADYKEPKSTEKPKILARGDNLPSYIPAGNFAVALMDIAARGPATDAVSSDGSSPMISLDNVRNNIVNIGNEHVQRALLTALDTAQGDLNKAQKNIEEWYNGSMDRVSGWYKRSTYWVIFWIGLVVSVGFNINTITIADYLYRNDAVREVMVKRAETIAADSTAAKMSYDQAKSQLDSLSLPIGWNDGWGAPRAGKPGFSFWNDLFCPVIGWLLTALAATLGAPFWFDLLNKVMVIRSTVKPKEKSAEEASKDPQAGKTSGVNGQTTIMVEDRDLPANPVSITKITPAVRDKDSNIDGCDVEITGETKDEDLPPAEGGVAQ